jgi:hypothetical protein
VTQAVLQLLHRYELSQYVSAGLHVVPRNVARWPASVTDRPSVRHVTQDSTANALCDFVQSCMVRVYRSSTAIASATPHCGTAPKSRPVAASRLAPAGLHTGPHSVSGPVFRSTFQPATQSLHTLCLQQQLVDSIAAASVHLASISKPAAISTRGEVHNVRTGTELPVQYQHGIVRSASGRCAAAKTAVFVLGF